jgi:hypothetical protein
MVFPCSSESQHSLSVSTNARTTMEGSAVTGPVSAPTQLHDVTRRRVVCGHGLQPRQQHRQLTGEVLLRHPPPPSRCPQLAPCDLGSVNGIARQPRRRPAASLSGGVAALVRRRPVAFAGLDPGSGGRSAPAMIRARRPARGSGWDRLRRGGRSCGNSGRAAVTYERTAGGPVTRSAPMDMPAICQSALHGIPRSTSQLPMRSHR